MQPRTAELIEHYPDRSDNLTDLLYDIQQTEGCVPADVVDLLARRYDVPAAEIDVLVAAAPHLTSAPQPRVVAVCQDGPCLTGGGASVLETLAAALPPEERDNTGVAVKKCHCIGMCEMAPAMHMGEHRYGAVDAESALDILEEALAVHE
jgi:NADH:ubiquinone oxidoreductase subunit E